MTNILYALSDKWEDSFIRFLMSHTEDIPFKMNFSAVSISVVSGKQSIHHLRNPLKKLKNIDN